MHAVLGGHQAGQEGRPGGRADGVDAVAAVELHSIGGQAVDVGCADVAIAVTAERPGGLVVGEDEDDVGTARGLGGNGLCREAEDRGTEEGGSDMHCWGSPGGVLGLGTWDWGE